MKNQITNLIIEREERVKKLMKEGKTDEVNTLFRKNSELLNKILKVSLPTLPNFPIIITNETLPELAKVLNELKDKVFASEYSFEKDDNKLYTTDFKNENIDIGDDYIRFINPDEPLSLDVNENTKIYYDMCDNLIFYNDKVSYKIMYSSYPEDTLKIMNLANKLIREY